MAKKDNKETKQPDVQASSTPQLSDPLKLGSPQASGGKLTKDDLRQLIEALPQGPLKKELKQRLKTGKIGRKLEDGELQQLGSIAPAGSNAAQIIQSRLSARGLAAAPGQPGQPGQPLPGGGPETFPPVPPLPPQGAPPPFGNFPEGTHGEAGPPAQPPFGGPLGPSDPMLPAQNAALTRPIPGLQTGSAGAVGSDIQSGINLGFQIAPELFQEAGLGRLQDARLAETNAALGTAQRVEQTSQNVSPELQAILARRQGGLEGLTAPELNALREQGRQAITQQSQTQARELARRQSLGGVRGAAATAQQQGVSRDALQAQKDLERQILLANVAERNQRLNNLQGLVTDRDTALFERGIRSSDFLNKAVQTTRGQEAELQKFNLSQHAAEIAGRTGAIGAGVGLIEKEEGREEEKDRFRKLLKLQRQQAANLDKIA